MNTFFIYLMAAADVFNSVVGWFFYDGMDNNLIQLAYDHIFCLNPTFPVRAGHQHPFSQSNNDSILLFNCA
jgi:hypothetical protein